MELLPTIWNLLLCAVFFNAVVLCIPSIGKYMFGLVIVRFIGGVEGKSYVNSSIRIWLNIWKSQILIECCQLKNKVTNFLDSCIGLPLSIEYAVVEHAVIELSLFQILMMGLNQQSPHDSSSKIRLILKGIHIQARTLLRNDWNTEEKRQQIISDLHTASQNAIEYFTNAIENAIAKKLKTSLQQKMNEMNNSPSYLSQLIDKLIDSIEISFYDVTVSIELFHSSMKLMNHMDKRNNILKASFHSLFLKSCGDEVDTKLLSSSCSSCSPREVLLENLILIFNEEKILHLPHLEGFVGLPKIMSVLMNPFPLPSKHLECHVQVKEITCCINDQFIQDQFSPFLLNILEYFQYYQDIEMLYLQKQKVCNETSFKEYVVLYEEKLIKKEKMLKKNQLLFDAMEKEFHIMDILTMRMKCRKWCERIQECFHQLKEKHEQFFHFENIQEIQKFFLLPIQEEEAVLRKFSIHGSIDSINIICLENNQSCCEFILTPLSINYMMDFVADNMNQEENNSVFLDLSVRLENLLFIVDTHSFGCDRSALLSHTNELYPLICLDWKWMQNGFMNIELDVHDLRWVMACKPVERFCIYLTTLIDYFMKMFPPIESSLNYSIKESIQDSNNNNNNNNEKIKIEFHSSALIQQNIKANFQLSNVSIVLAHDGGKSISKEHKAFHALECIVSIECKCECNELNEDLKIELTQLGFYPKIIETNPMDEFSSIHSNVSSNSLLKPIEMHLIYQGQFHQDSISSLNVDIYLSDFSLTFSQFNFMIFIQCLNDVSNLQMTSKELLEKQKLQEEKRIIDQQSFLLEQQLSLLKHAFQTLDVNQSGDLDKNELMDLIRYLPSSRLLLQSELYSVTNTLFQAIDKDQNGTIEFHEFEQYINEYSMHPMNHPLQGKLNLKGIDYCEMDIHASYLSPCDGSMDLFFQDKNCQMIFWKVLEEETKYTKDSFISSLHFNLIIFQKKLVRLVKDYYFAERIWSELIKKNSNINSFMEWKLNPLDRMGGPCDFQLISSSPILSFHSKLDHQKNHEEEDEEVKRRVHHEDNEKKKKKDLEIHLNICINNIRFRISDPTIPFDLYRGDFYFGDCKIYGKILSCLKEKENDEEKKMGNYCNLDINMTLSCRMEANCYSNLGMDMEPLIENWKLNAGIRSQMNEDGFIILIQAPKYLQFNLTTSFVSICEMIFQAMNPSFQIPYQNMHEQAVLYTKQYALHVTNLTHLKCQIRAYHPSSSSPSSSSSSTSHHENEYNEIENSDENEEKTLDWIDIPYEHSIAFQSKEQQEKEEEEENDDDDNDHKEDYLLPQKLILSIPNWGCSSILNTKDLLSSQVFIPSNRISDKKEISSLPIVCELSDVGKKGKSLILRSNLSLKNQTFHPIQIEIKIPMNQHDNNDGNNNNNTNIIQRLECNDTIYLPICCHVMNSTIFIKEGKAFEQKREFHLNCNLFQNDEKWIEMNSQEEKGIEIECKEYLNTLNREIRKEWEIQLLPSFMIRNGLPYSLEYILIKENQCTQEITQMFERNQQEKIQQFISISSSVFFIYNGKLMTGMENEIEPIHLQTKESYVGFIRLINEKDFSLSSSSSSWSCGINITPPLHTDQFNENIENKSSIHLNNGIFINYEIMTLSKYPFVLHFSCSFWIINKTNCNFLMKSPPLNQTPSSLSFPISPKKLKMNNNNNNNNYNYNKEDEEMKKKKGNGIELHTSSFNHPILANHLNNDLLMICPLDTINNPEQYPSSWNQLKHIDCGHLILNETMEWSTPVNVSAVNTTGEILCGQNIFGLSISSLNGIFHGTKCVIITSRYMIKNCTSHDLFYQPFLMNPNELEKINHHPQIEDLISYSIPSQSCHIPYGFQSFTKQENKQQNNLMPFLTISSLAQRSHPLFFPSNFSEKKKTFESSSPLKKKKKLYNHLLQYAIPINTHGEFQLLVVQDQENPHGLFILQISLQVVEQQVMIVLSNISNCPPYRIENYSNCCLYYQQEAEEKDLSKMNEIQPHSWKSFAWDNILASSHQLEISLFNDQMNNRNKKKKREKWIYSMDEIKTYPCLLSKDEETNKMIQLTIETFLDGSTRVIRIMEAIHQETRHSTLNRISASVKDFYACNIDIRFVGVGISIFNSRPQEVLFLSIDHINFMKPAFSLAWSFEIFHIQIDNGLKKAFYPVVLEPVGYGHSSLNEQDPKSMIELKVDVSISERIFAFELFDFYLAPINLKLDVDYILMVLQVLDPLFNTSNHSVDQPKQKVHALLSAQLIEPIEMSNFSLFYFESFTIQSTGINIEYILRRKNIKPQKYMSPPMEMLMELIALVGSNLNGSPSLSFTATHISKCFMSMDRLLHRLITSYTRQAMLQIYQIFASIDILGNPIGLVGDVKGGLMQFMQITKGEILGETGTRGEGAKVLGKTLVRTGASSAAKITGTLNRYVSSFEDDDKNQDEMQNNQEYMDQEEIEQKDTRTMQGLKMAKKFKKSITGIVTKPIDGAKKGGIKGFLTGTVKGLAGPGVACLSAVTSTSHSLFQGVENSLIDRKSFQGRRRMPRQFQDRLMISDTLKDLKGSLLTVKVIGARGLLSHRSCDPICFLYIDERQIFKTKTVYNTVNPNWNEKKEIVLTGQEKKLQVAVKDSSGAIISLIGVVSIPIKQLVYDFQPPEKETALDVWTRTGVPPEKITENDFTQAKAPPRDYILEGSRKLKKDATAIHIVVTIVEVTDLKPLSGLLSRFSPKLKAHLPDPFVTIGVGSRRDQTSCKSNTLEALFDESFTYLVGKDTSKVNNKMIFGFAVYNKGVVRNDLMGKAEVEINLNEKNEEILEKTLSLQKSKDKNELGKLRIRIQISEESNSGIVKKGSDSKVTVRSNTGNIRLQVDIQ